MFHTYFPWAEFVRSFHWHVRRASFYLPRQRSNDTARQPIITPYNRVATPCFGIVCSASANTLVCVELSLCTTNLCSAALSRFSNVHTHFPPTSINPSSISSRSNQQQRHTRIIHTRSKHRPLQMQSNGIGGDLNESLIISICTLCDMWYLIVRTRYT